MVTGVDDGAALSGEQPPTQNAAHKIVARVTKRIVVRLLYRGFSSRREYSAVARPTIIVVYVQKVASAPSHRRGLTKTQFPYQALRVDAFHGSVRHQARGRALSRSRLMPNTVRFHRVLRATPERVYRAFLDADAMVKWLPPNGFTGKVHHLEAKVGGSYRMSFTNFTNGKSHSFGGLYLELVPNQTIVHTDKFDDPNLPGEMKVTINLKPVSCDTELNIVQEGIPDVIPPEACCLGWQESLTLLAQLVEAEIPG
jgi:uncharacterized protein YndB with AHSA1/START domain